MKTIEWPDYLAGTLVGLPLAATIGVFDGLHIGHRALIEKILGKEGLVSAVFTFRDNPKRDSRRMAFQGELSTLGQKLELLESMGVDICVLIDFSGDFSKLPGRRFLSLLSDGAALRYLVLGADFRCGFRLDTDGSAISSFCEERAIEVELLAELEWESRPVSSSRIREAVRGARLEAAAAMLGRPYEIDLRAFPASRQAMPPVGRYEAELLFQEARREALSIVVAIDEEGDWRASEAGNLHGTDALEGQGLKGLGPKGLRLIRKVSRE